MKEKTRRPDGKGWVWDEEKGKWFRVRKLTPRSCFRLMGVRDADIDKILAYPYKTLAEHPVYAKRCLSKSEVRQEMKGSISESQLYKMAGNSIVVDVMYHCFCNLFYPETGKAKKEEKAVAAAADWTLF